jgi:ankyrin repeat protein
VFYQILTGEVPFSGPTPLVVMQKHCEEEAPSLRRARPDVPERLVEVVNRCLSKEPSGRYQRAAALSGELDHVRLELEFAALSGEVPSDRRPSLYSTRALISLQRQRTAGLGPVRRWASFLWGAVAAAWLYAEGQLDPDIVSYRRAAARMEQALADLAEAKQKRAELRRRAAEVRAQAERARRSPADAQGAGRAPLAEQSAEHEALCEAAATQLSSVADSLADAVGQLEDRYRRASQSHDRLRTKVGLKEAQAVGDIRSQGVRGRRRTIALAAAVFLMLTAVCMWGYALHTRAWDTDRQTPARAGRNAPDFGIPSSLSISEVRALVSATRRGELRTMRRLLRQVKPEELRGGYGRWLVLTAAVAGRAEATDLLLSSGVVFPRGTQSSRSALHHAAEGGHLAVVEALLAHGAPLDPTDRRKQTPLHFAARWGHEEVVDVLLSAGANVNASDETGTTALHWAAREGHCRIVELLLAEGAVLESVRDKRQRPLHWAARCGRTEAANILLGRGAAVDPLEAADQTPLHEATWEGHVETVRLLLAHGADVEARDIRGKTPLHVAVLGGHGAVVQVLLDSGADVNAVDRTGQTPATMASEARRGDIAALLQQAATVL